MERDLSDDLINVPFAFTARRRPLPVELRPSYRIPALLLIVSYCRGGRASIEQLHVLDWSLRSPRSRELFLAFIEGEKSPSEVVVRLDPSLSRAIDFALGEDLVTQREPSLLKDDAPSGASFRLMLTPKGKALVKELIGLEDCFEEEKAFLDNIGTKVTQEQISALFDWNI